MNKKTFLYSGITALFLILFILSINSPKNRECLADNKWYKSRKVDYYSLGKFEEKPKYLIIHHSQANSIKQLKKIFEDYGVSCHYFIDNKGKIHKAIDTKCVAYHAGPSYWNGDTKLNTSSICIEILNKNPFKKDITNKQYKTLIKLSKKIMKEENIVKYNVLSHSDIAIFADNETNQEAGLTNLSNRKQDISYLFRWKKLAKKGVGFWYDEEGITKNDSVLFYFGDQNPEIKEIKEKLAGIGYKVEVNDYYDINMFMISIIFHRRFYPDNLILAAQGLWTHSSMSVLNRVSDKIADLRNN